MPSTIYNMPLLALTLGYSQKRDAVEISRGLSVDASGKPAPPFIGVRIVDVTYSPGCACSSFCLFSLYSAFQGCLFVAGVVIISSHCSHFRAHNTTLIWTNLAMLCLNF